MMVVRCGGGAWRDDDGALRDDGDGKYCHHLHYLKSDCYICVLITSW